MAEIDALLYLPGHPRRAAAAALRIPALSPRVAGVVPGACSTQAEPAGGPAGNAGPRPR